MAIRKRHKRRLNVFDAWDWRRKLKKHAMVACARTEPLSIEWYTRYEGKPR